MIDIVIAWSFDSFVELCDSGNMYELKNIEPNEGKFDKEFIFKFIEFVRNGSYERKHEFEIHQGCDECIANHKEFCSQMKTMILDCSEGFESKQLINNILS